MRVSQTTAIKIKRRRHKNPVGLEETFKSAINRTDKRVTRKSQRENSF